MTLKMKSVAKPQSQSIMLIHETNELINEFDALLKELNESLNFLRVDMPMKKSKQVFSQPLPPLGPLSQEINTVNLRLKALIQEISEMVQAYNL